MVAATLLARVPIADTGLHVTMWVPGDGFFAKLQRGETKLQWSRVLQIMQRYYLEAATELNLLAVEEFHRSSRRPNVSTHRLESALLDDRNILIRQDSFYAGYPAFLDKSNAKYWRQIEEGYAGHVGRRIYGVWGGSLTGGWATSSAGNRYALAGPAYTAHRYGAGGKFQPLSTLPADATVGRTKRRHQAAADRGHAGGSVNYGGRISRPIAAEDYYSKAFMRFRRSNRPLNLLREVIAAELGMRKASVPRSYQAILSNVL